MTPQIKKLLKAHPFRPFTLETRGGNKIRVERAEWFFEPPEGKGTAIVFDPEGDYWIIDYGDLLRNISIEGAGR